MKSYFWC